ncbi:MAG: hypothetical protein AAFZ18_36725, partial [Myxococcota bacterium]
AVLKSSEAAREFRAAMARAAEPPQMPANAIAPGSAVIFVLTMAGVHPRHLRRVGLTMVAAYAMTLVMLWLRNTS